MGNRAVITTLENWKNDGVGIYLHWNGGRDSVEGFLKYCELKGYRSPSQDSYGFARLCQVIGNFFSGGLSVGIDTIWHLDYNNGDNGVYIIEDWKIVDRYFFEGKEQAEYSLDEMLLAIDERMPKEDQFGEEFFSAKLTPTEWLKVGDEIFWIDYSGHVERDTVIGFGGEEPVNGQYVSGVPYIKLYNSNDPSKNINNYLRGKEYRVIVKK